MSSLNLVQSSPGTTGLVDGGTVLQLTPNYDTNPGGALAPAGAAWTTTTVNVADPFTVNFEFEMSNPTGHLDNGNGGDGIAFVIQDSAAGDTALGLGAGGMGFLFIPDSVAIMLDTYQNSSPDFYGDPSDNYIAVNTRGTQFNVPHHYCTDGLLTADSAIGSDLPGSLGDCTANPTLAMTGGGSAFGSLPALTTDLDDGKVHDLEINYTGSVLQVYLDSQLVLSTAIDLATVLDLAGGTNAYIGFTAGTRFAYQDQDILSFCYSSAVPEPTLIQLSIPLVMLLGIGIYRRSQRDRA